MNVTHLFTIMVYLEYSILLPFILTGLILSTIWNVYFVKEIRKFIKLRHACVEKAKSDPFGNFSSEADHYRTEIIKYSFLFMINLSEIGSVPIYALGAACAFVFSSQNHVFIPTRVKIPNCTSELIHSSIFHLQLIYGDPLSSILVTFGQTGLMLSLAFSICLMKYLHKVYHNISYSPPHDIRRLLLVSALVAVFLIITGSVPQLMILHQLIEPLAQFIYFCVWIKHTRKFYKTLKWRSIEFQLRGNDARLVRRSVLSCRQFAVIMWCMGIGYACVILSEFMSEYFSLTAIALHYGPCVFNYLYGTPYYKPLLSTQQQIDDLYHSYEIESAITLPLGVGAILFVGVQYILSTVVFFGGILIQKLRYRYGKVRIRFSPDLSRHLLSE